jgi:protein-disulfide isomerase
VLRYYEGMSKTAKPIVVIVLALVLAGGTAFYLTRSDGEATGVDSAPESASGMGPGRSKGPAEAPLTLVEFGDYQCPVCRAYHPVVEEVLARFPEQVRLEFHHYPLIQIHAHAMTASMAVEAAGEQGKYWEMHDLVLELQPEWSQRANPESEFISMAGRLGLDSNRFMQDMRSLVLQDRILKDVVAAREGNIQGVPAFFLNGKHIQPRQSVDDFARIIEAELQALP